MISTLKDILGETVGDTIVLPFTLTLDGGAFPVDSTWLFGAELNGLTITQSGVAVNNGTSTTVTVTIPSTKTTVKGKYKYYLTETTVGGSLRTPVRGTLELIEK